jgi:hypothetical protein
LEGQYDRWEIKINVEDHGVTESHSVIRLETKAKVKEEFVSLLTPFGKAKLLRKMGIPGVIVEVVGLYRHRGMTERIHVKEYEPQSGPSGIDER